MPRARSPTAFSTGSLTLRGGGDPSLTGDDLQAMAKQLAASGIKKVDGSFLYDATRH